MSKSVKFVLNTGDQGGRTVIQELARPAVKKAGDRIAGRATHISANLRTHGQSFEVSEISIGIPNSRGGRRVYAKVSAVEPNGGRAYELDKQALDMALDAGRVTRLGF